ncbi:MAG TPA: hypothetical protein VKI64_06930 [Acidimicrobiales bacterium]|nr:hypothetical protein [Acidimicrobiales bacterium]
MTKLTSRPRTYVRRFRRVLLFVMVAVATVVASAAGIAREGNVLLPPPPSPGPPPTGGGGPTMVAGADAAIQPALAWERRWPGVTFRESSPVQADLGRPAVVVGALNGQVYGLDAVTGADLPGWPVATGHPINSSPAAADLYGIGSEEVVVASGWADNGRCGGGGVFMIDPSGAVRWARAGADPLCNGLAFHSSPAVGDITGAGVADVTVGALGLQSWSWDVNGRLNPGWPFYTDDTVFATPALADLSGDGTTEVVMGGDASPGGVFRPNHRGGVVRAVRGDGRLLWRFTTDEIVRSSPAVGDLDGHHGQSIVFGTGNYWVSQPGGASDYDRVTALDTAGRSRWSRHLGGETLGAPALADVAGTGQRDVVIGTADGPSGGRVWVLGPDGAPLPQWGGVPSGGGVVIGGVSTADLNSDGAQDLLVPTGSGVFAYDGRTAQLLFSIDAGQVGFQSTPLVTVDPGGALGITVTGTGPNGEGVVQHWVMPAASGAQLGSMGWPTFHHDARRTGNASPPPLAQRQCRGLGIAGYWEAAGDGGVFGWCGAGFHGRPPAGSLAAPVVAMASSATGGGYWEAAADGGVFAFGDAPYLGSAHGAQLRAPIVGMAHTPDGRGYWLASADGGVFAFGDAPFEGGGGGVTLPFRISAILATPSGRGYWLIGDEGSVVTYGDAHFFGSIGALPMRSPIVGAAATPSGQGYWLVAADGGVFTYGDAPFLGSAGGARLSMPIVGMAETAAGRGYWMVAADGGVFAFGDAHFAGSTAGLHLNSPVRAIAVPAG